MGDPKLLLAVILFSLLLSPSAKVVADSGADASGRSSSGRSLGSDLGWQILTNRNFSSQIRRHPHILLMVTVPWSGESRSLMNEIAHLVADKKEKLGFLRLMVVYKNSDKMVADVLGATEGITLFYYHHSMSYKYHGRLRLQNILSSIYHFMSLKHEEIPLKPLHSQEDLQIFFESTDKAILLLEFCGWSAKLLHRNNNENYETLSVQNSSEHVDIIGENFARGEDRTLAFHNAIQKGEENEELTCEVKDGIAGSHLLGGFTLANQSALKEDENKSVGYGKSCTKEEFQRFESVFMKFTAIAREHFLPPERQRFGLISQRSLLPFLGVGNPETWLIILHSSGCPNCSVILQEGDDLRTILRNHYSLVMELDPDGRNLEPAFPSDRPSIILFVDRSSESSKVRRESKSSLEVLRKFAWYNQISYQRISGLDGSISKSSSGQASFGMLSRSISDALGHRTRKDNLASRIVKIKDNMAIMIVNEGEGISLKNTAPDNQGNSVYDMLTHLLHQKEHALKNKETKISRLAKEVGFQLLSDDFEVQVVDPMPSNENAQSENMIKSGATSPKDETSELPKEAVEPYVSMNDADLSDATDITAVDEGKQPETIDMETDFHQTQEAVTYELQTNKFSTKLDREVKVDIGVFNSTQLSEDQKCCNQEEPGSFTSHDENSFHLEQKSPHDMEYIKKEQVEHADCCSNGTSSGEVAPNLANISSLDVSGYDVDENKKFTIVSNADSLHDQYQPFFSSFFFSDGGYQLLRALTGGSKIPSLIILDPVRQQHFVFSEETEISYNSLLNFVDKFLNQSLTPYQRSALSTHSSRETPRPPFVNLDFHEADCIPRVTANTFCELVVGFESCETGNVVSFSNTESLFSAWKLDVLVLFTTSWCGFCQRMELVVREVYRALKSFMNMPKSHAKNVDPTQIKDKKEDFALHGLPSILVMDCILNDCSSFLKPMGERELYPALLLFPAENKSAIYYEGDMSVIDIMEFLVSHGSNSHYLSRNKGFLWTHACKRSKNRATSHDVSSLSVHEQAHYAEDQHKLFFHTEVRGNVDHPIGSRTSGNFHDEYKHVDVGSILAATDKLINAFPFDNSTVLIVMADQKQGFQGMITNKRISWDVFKELDKDLEPLKQAPLFYGGPVMAPRMPLVSLTRKEIEEYTKVVTGIYFGNPMATSLTIERIKSGDHSAIDYWFFLGYSSWAYNQLFDELAEGTWNLSESPIEYLDWPDS